MKSAPESVPPASPPDIVSPVRSGLLPALLLPLLLVLTGAPAIPGGFLGDDFNILLDLQTYGIFRFALLGEGETGTLPFWRPGAFALLGLQQHLFGARAGGYLAISSLLHLGVTLLAARLYRRWMSPGWTWAATALFALHPRHLEAQAWISAQPDLWAALGVCGCLATLTRVDRAEASRARRIAWGLGWAGWALLSKESALALLPLAWWLGWLSPSPPVGGEGEGESPTRAEVLPTLGLLTLLTGAYVGARALALGTLVGGYGSATHLSFSPLAVLKPVATFTLNLLVPWHSSGLQQQLRLLLAPGRAAMAGAEGRLHGLEPLWPGLVLGLLTLSLAGFWWRRASRSERHHLLRWGGAFLLCLLPYLNLAVSLEGRSDRYLYLPSLFFSPLLVLALQRITGPRARVAVLGSLLLIFAAARLDLALLWQAAGQSTTRLVEAVVVQARSASTDRLYLAGVPDRRGGVGMLFTGLPRVLTADARSRGVAPPQVIIAARTRGTRTRDALIRWDVGAVPSDGSERARVLIGRGDGLFEGGWGWNDWRSDRRGEEQPVPELSLPLRQDGDWLLIEGVEVRLLR